MGRRCFWEMLNGQDSATDRRRLTEDDTILSVLSTKESMFEGTHKVNDKSVWNTKDKYYT